MSKKQTFLLILSVLLAFAGCSETASKTSDKKVTLLLAGYGASRDAFKKVIPAFQKHWLEKTGQNVLVKQSYGSSGTQSRAIVAGFEADVAALAVEIDMDRLVEEKLITHDWKQHFAGMVTHSVVVFAVRQGNPFKIQQWDDLVAREIELLMPNPKTSGGAQWNVLSAYGAAIRGQVPDYPQNKAEKLLVDLLEHVTVMDKGSRESIINFEFGAGDVAITYESEALVGRAHGQNYEVVVPQSSIIVENPVAVVDVNAKKHGVEVVAHGFVDFLFSQEAQQMFAQSGFRPIRPEVMNEYIDQFPFVSDLWTVSYLGGWEKIQSEFFGPKGIYTRAIKEVRER